MERKNVYSVVKASLITEKTTRLSPNRQYCFWVDSGVNKIEIRKSVEKIYSVKVDKVASLIVKGKTKRIRQNQSGKTVAWKKAIVTLKKGQEIKLT